MLTVFYSFCHDTKAENLAQLGDNSDDAQIFIIDQNVFCKQPVNFQPINRQLAKIG